MKEIVSTAEKQFLQNAIANSKRLDGRESYDYRSVRITFGTEKGCCEVQLGQTRVLAQTSCEVVKPSASRPTDGILHINLELSPMASPSFEVGRMSTHGVELNRLLERSVKESRVVDMENLCIVAGEKTWQIRVDIHTLNDEGNLLDCSSIAAIASLHHFRRPDVTVSGEDVIIHTVDDRDPVPLSIHHMPICVTFAFFQEGNFLLVDPSAQEETVMDGTMVVCMNIHRELCTVQMTGTMLLLKDQLSRCCQIAVVKVSEITEVIQQALANDIIARKEGKKFGFAESRVHSRITTNRMDEQTIKIIKKKDDEESSVEDDAGEEEMETDETLKFSNAVRVDKLGVGIIGQGLETTWCIPEEDDDEIDDKNLNMAVENTETKSRHVAEAKTNDNKIMGSDSEEEDTIVIVSQERQILPQEGEKELDLSCAIKIPSSRGKSKGKKAARKKHRAGPK